MSASKANFTAALPLFTGGSWKKSPRRWLEVAVCTCIAPNGSGRLRIIEPMRASLSNRSPSTIDTADGTVSGSFGVNQTNDRLPSSMMRTLVRNHRVVAFLFFCTLLASCSADSVPRPIPANE
ncbi:hypothetical protein C8Q70DRAFT_926541 [Cubamyces menziesii]|nr:hypothetical protein C8Q70DRAFT_926541 [Cubamyces menziesii]